MPIKRQPSQRKSHRFEFELLQKSNQLQFENVELVQAQICWIIWSK